MRIEAAVRGADYASLACALDTGADPVVALSDWAAGIYARSGNFTLLHLVTGMRAVRVLQPWADDPASVIPGLVRALTAAVLASNLNMATRPAPQRTWDQARQAAIASDDEHVIKLVHACIEGRLALGDGQRLAAANRALEREPL